jgi:hypothetical protein
VFYESSNVEHLLLSLPHYLKNTQFGSENCGQPNVDPQRKTMFVQSSAELGGKLLSTPNVGGKFLACHGAAQPMTI